MAGPDQNDLVPNERAHPWSAGMVFPLLIGTILWGGLDAGSVLIAFGVVRVIATLALSGKVRVHPFLVIVALSIAQKTGGNALFSSGFAMALVALVLAASPVRKFFRTFIPERVVWGLKFGLGLQLGLIALKDYIRAEAGVGYVIAGISLLFLLLCLGNRRYSPAGCLLLVGLGYACLFRIGWRGLGDAVGVHLPKFHWPGIQDAWLGIARLALPQIPLFLISAAEAEELDGPAREDGVRPKMPLAWWVIAGSNLISALAGGVPVTLEESRTSDGQGRWRATQWREIAVGGAFIICGVVFSRGCAQIVQAFPLPLLGVLLLFEALALLAVLGKLLPTPANLTFVLLLGLIANGLPCGYVVALVLGLAFHRPTLGWMLDALNVWSERDHAPD